MGQTAEIDFENPIQDAPAPGCANELLAVFLFEPLEITDQRAEGRSDCLLAIQPLVLVLPFGMLLQDFLDMFLPVQGPAQISSVTCRAMRARF